MVPLKITPEFKQELMRQFMEKLNSIKEGETSIKIEQSFTTKPTNRPQIIFSERAYVKTLALIMDNSTEIAWHGIVERLGDLVFRIEDIMVYPQTVSSANVETDEKEYSDWLSSQPDDLLEKIRFQGHSHVRMQVSPSATDLEQQESIVNQFIEGDYYIFAIFNKDLRINIWLYDSNTNAKYDASDIDVHIVSPELTRELDELAADCKEKVADRAKSWKAADTSKTNEKKEKPKQPKLKNAKKAKEKEESWANYADNYYCDGTPRKAPSVRDVPPLYAYTGVSDYDYDF